MSKILIVLAIVILYISYGEASPVSNESQEGNFSSCTVTRHTAFNDSAKNWDFPTKGVIIQPFNQLCDLTHV